MKNLKVYYTDDDHDDLDLVMSVMSEIGVQASSFNAGESMMAALEKDNPLPDVIYLDLNMPRRHGFEILADLKQDSRFKDIPVVIYTTSGRPEIIKKAQELGASLFVKKPVSFNEMTNAIKTTISYDWQSFRPDKTNFIYQSDTA